MSKWSVECECVCMGPDEQMVSGLNDCDCVAQVPCTGSVQHRLKTDLFSVDHEVYMGHSLENGTKEGAVFPMK